jgi:hypothetical protein
MSGTHKVSDHHLHQEQQQQPKIPQTSQQLTQKPMVPVQLSNVLHSYRSMSKPALHTEITADGDWIKTYTLAQKLLRF